MTNAQLYVDAQLLSILRQLECCFLVNCLNKIQIQQRREQQEQEQLYLSLSRSATSVGIACSLFI